MTEEQTTKMKEFTDFYHASVVCERCQQTLDLLRKARDLDSQGKHSESREQLSLAISKLSFLLDYMIEPK